MTECIMIPFLPEFQDRMLSGAKTATSRTEKYGNGGDIFMAFGHSFQLTKVNKVYLGDVATTFYKEEGFNNPGEFRDCWKRLHPKRNRYDQPVWLHQFKRVV